MSVIKVVVTRGNESLDGRGEEREGQGNMYSGKSLQTSSSLVTCDCPLSRIVTIFNQIPPIPNAWLRSWLRLYDVVWTIFDFDAK